MTFTKRFTTEKDVEDYVLKRLDELHRDFAFYEEDFNEDMIDSRSKVEKLLSDEQFILDYGRLLYASDECEHPHTDFDSPACSKRIARLSHKLMDKYDLPCIEY